MSVWADRINLSNLTELFRPSHWFANRMIRLSAESRYAIGYFTPFAGTAGSKMLLSPSQSVSRCGQS
jgi:hypothetical protein